MDSKVNESPSNSKKKHKKKKKTQLTGSFLHNKNDNGNVGGSGFE